MLNNQFRNIDSFIDNLNTHLSSKRNILSLIFIFLVISLTITGFLSGVSRFSPDSWAYYELSKTVFENSFYNFNTYRSYYSEINSTSFPFGYPILLAIAQYIFGHSPFTAVIVNLIVAFSSWLITIRLLEKCRLSLFSSVAIATSLILFTPYLDEVFAGRSIPVAILLFTLCIYAFISNRFILCGSLLGLSALIRFDHLAYGLILQLLIYLLDFRKIKRSFMIGLGFILGILPWILYSQFYFGKFWVSDNSWVALSALPAFVVDYPASATITAFENPALWFDRIASNIFPLIISVVKSSLRFPLLPILLCLCLLFFHHIKKSGNHRILILSFLSIGSSFGPFLLTGYFDSRYFALSFLVFSSLLVFFIETTYLDQLKIRTYRYFLILSICFSTLLGSIYMAKIGYAWIKGYGSPDDEVDIIMGLNRCHLSQPEVTFIFAYTRLAARYGATTGNRTAFLPSNFTRLSDVEKSKYFERMEPYFLIEDVFKADSCPRTR